jgi:hypothetical protein
MAMYSLENVREVIACGFEYEMDPEVIQRINTLATELNMIDSFIRSTHYIQNPAPIKTSVSKLPIKGTNLSFTESSSANSFERLKKKKSNKAFEVSNEEWETVRSFHITKLETKTGVNSIVDQIRISLNKLTDKTFLDMRTNIIQIIESLTPEDLMEAKDRLSQEIFTISSQNMFYSKIFADLYAELATSHLWLRPYFDQQLSEYCKVFAGLTYVDSNENYDKFCEMNKINAALRANSKFYLNLCLNGFISKETIMEKMCELLTMILDMYLDTEKINIAAEITENIAILYDKELLQQYEGNTDYWINGKSIMETIGFLSKCKSKECKGLSNKTIFKYMDLVES